MISSDMFRDWRRALRSKPICNVDPQFSDAFFVYLTFDSQCCCDVHRQKAHVDLLFVGECVSENFVIIFLHQNRLLFVWRCGQCSTLAVTSGDLLRSKPSARMQCKHFFLIVVVSVKPHSHKKTRYVLLALPQNTLYHIGKRTNMWVRRWFALHFIYISHSFSGIWQTEKK